MGMEYRHQVDVETAASGEIETAILKDLINKEKTGRFRSVERPEDAGLTEMPQIEFKVLTLGKGGQQYKVFLLKSESIIVDSKGENVPGRVYVLTSNEGTHPANSRYQKARVYRLFFIDPGSNSFDQRTNLVGGVNLNFSEGSEVGELKMVEVMPAFQRRGFGELLKEKAVEFFESIGVNKIHFNVLASPDSMGAATHNYKHT